MNDKMFSDDVDAFTKRFGKLKLTFERQSYEGTSHLQVHARFALPGSSRVYHYAMRRPQGELHFRHLHQVVVTMTHRAKREELATDDDEREFWASVLPREIAAAQAIAKFPRPDRCTIAELEAHVFDNLQGACTL